MVIIIIMENKKFILHYKVKPGAFLQVSWKVEVKTSGFQLLVYTQLCIFSRVFVNRSLSLDNINYFGFDMDYTLAGEFPKYFKRSCSVFGFLFLLDPQLYLKVLLTDPCPSICLSVCVSIWNAFFSGLAHHFFSRFLVKVKI